MALSQHYTFLDASKNIYGMNLGNVWNAREIDVSDDENPNSLDALKNANVDENNYMISISHATDKHNNVMKTVYDQNSGDDEKLSQNAEKAMIRSQMFTTRQNPKDDSKEKIVKDEKSSGYNVIVVVLAVLMLLLALWFFFL